MAALVARLGGRVKGGRSLAGPPRRRYGPAMHLVLSWVGLSAGFWLTAQLVDGFRVNGVKGALVASAVFGILHHAIGWLIFTVIGLGTLFLGFVFAFVTRWIVSAILLRLTDRLTQSLEIDRFRTALVASAVLSVLSALGDWLSPY